MAGSLRPLFVRPVARRMNQSYNVHFFMPVTEGQRIDNDVGELRYRFFVSSADAPRRPVAKLPDLSRLLLNQAGKIVKPARSVSIRSPRKM